MGMVKPEYSPLLRTSLAPRGDLKSLEKSRLKGAWVPRAQDGGLGSRTQAVRERAKFWSPGLGRGLE